MAKRKAPKVFVENISDHEEMPRSDAAPNDSAIGQNEAVPEPSQARKITALPPLAAALELVRRGHPDGLARLRKCLRESPAIWQQVGDLGRQAQHAWADRIAGPDHLLRESIVLNAEEMKESLVGQCATRLEKLAAERIVAAWMETEYFRIWRVQHPEADSTKVGELHTKRFEAADRRLERSLQSLALVKRLLPKTIEVEVIQRPVAAPTTSPIVSGTFKHDLRMSDDVPAATLKTSAMNGTTIAGNGVNRMTGTLNGSNNRLNGVLEPLNSN